MILPLQRCTVRTCWAGAWSSLPAAMHPANYSANHVIRTMECDLLLCVQASRASVEGRYRKWQKAVQRALELDDLVDEC